MSKCLCVCGQFVSRFYTRTQTACIMSDVTWRAAAARESTVLVDTKISPPSVVICRKSKQLHCHDAAVESAKQSACVKPVYSCLFAKMFILTLRDLVGILFAFGLNIQQF